MSGDMPAAVTFSSVDFVQPADERIPQRYHISSAYYSYHPEQKEVVVEESGKHDGESEHELSSTSTSAPYSRTKAVKSSDIDVSRVQSGQLSHALDLSSHVVISASPTTSRKDKSLDRSTQPSITDQEQRDVVWDRKMSQKQAEQQQKAFQDQMLDVEETASGDSKKRKVQSEKSDSESELPMPSSRRNGIKKQEPQNTSAMFCKTEDGRWER